MKHWIRGCGRCSNCKVFRKNMSTKPRLLVPYGLKTLLEGLSRAVVSAQPANIAHYASYYFMELLQYRQENPSMDFRDLVQEFQRRQENIQKQFSPAENSTSGISYPLVPKDKAESEMVESEKGQCPAEEDPCTGDASVAEVMHAFLNGKYPLLYRDISNPLVSAQRVKYRLQEQRSAGVEASSEQNAEKPERLDKVSSKTQSQSIPTVAKKASVSGTVPKKSNDQIVYTATRWEDFDGQYSLPRGVPSNGRGTEGATACFPPLSPEKNISKPQNVVNLPRDVHRIVSKMSQHSPDQARLFALGSAIYFAKQTVESQVPAAVPPTQAVARLKITSGPTENQQRTTEMASSNREVCYEPAYIPGKDASMVHIVKAVPTERTGPTMVPAETASVHYKAAPKLTPSDTIQSPSVYCRHPPQDPVTYKSTYVPSQTGISQQCVCQMPLCPHLEQQTYGRTERKYYAPYIQKTSNSPEAVSKEGYSDASSQMPPSELNQACSDTVMRNLIGSPGCSIFKTS